MIAGVGLILAAVLFAAGFRMLILLAEIAWAWRRGYWAMEHVLGLGFLSLIPAVLFGAGTLLALEAYLLLGGGW